VALETYTGLKAFEATRADPPLVSSIISSVGNTLCNIYLTSYLIFQKEHCEDALLSKKSFITIADPKAGSLEKRTTANLLYNIIRKTISRHSIRPTSVEVCLIQVDVHGSPGQL